MLFLSSLGRSAMAYVMNPVRALVAVCVVLWMCGCTEPPAYQQTLPEPNAGLIILGDTQRTLSVEARVFQREQNDEERETLLHFVAEMAADGLIHLGDLVADGASDSDWRYFDRIMEPLRHKNLPLLLAVGNHDYWGDNRAAMHQLHARFAEVAASHWYAKRYGHMVLVFLDTNQQELGDAAWSEQSAWFRRLLETLESDSETRMILVFAHHPPFSNSKITGDEEHVQNTFLESFFASTKTAAFMTGHAHAYERFEDRGRFFIVSGGAGGPRVELYAGAQERHTDLYAGPSPRPFHFLHLVPTASGAEITVRGFDSGESDLRVLERFELQATGEPD